MSKDIEKTIAELESEEKTAFEGEAEKPKKGRKKSTGKTHSEDDLAQYFVLIFNFICKLTNVPHRFTKSDFSLEADMMKSIAKKWKIVETGLTFTAPLILIISMAEKGFAIYSAKKEEKIRFEEKANDPENSQIR